MRTRLRVATAIFPLVLLTSCIDIDEGGWDQYKEDFHYTYPLAQDGRFSLENQNGRVEISVWDQDKVEITGTKHGRYQDSVKNTRIEIQATPNSVSVRTVPSSTWRGVGATYSIRLPRRVQLERVVSSNGRVSVDDVQGNMNLHTTNGSIRLLHTKGDLDLQTTNGGIDIQHTGNARVRSSNGSMHIEVAKGLLEASSTNGKIEARITDPEPNASYRLESSNGHIDVSMNQAREIRAHTTNSGITLRIPADSNARLRAQNSNSSITTEFDVMVRGGLESKHSISGNLGSGGPLLDLTTSNGPIKVLKL